MAPRLQVRLLGQPQLRVDDAVRVVQAPPRAISLLVYLLLHRAEATARDALAFLFWPDVLEAEARAKLRTHLHAVRTSVLPEDDREPWLIADKRTVQWNPNASVWLDVAEYERLAVDPAHAAEAVELYGGDLATGIDEEWLQGPRERLREQQALLLTNLVEASRSRGDARAAIDYAQRLLKHDPWREDGVRALIALRYEHGDRAGALHTYREFAKRLQGELGVEPMPETTAAYRRVAEAHEPLAPAAVVAAPPVATVERPQHNIPSTLTTFVGREAEIERLRSLVAERRLVTLTGSAGVGKSRLALETARSVIDVFADGVWLVEFAPLADPAHILPSIANALGLENDTERSLLAVLRGKHLLLVIDNCEHLIDEVAATVQRLLGECPRLHILATSREPLQLAGERTERVSCLPLPDIDERTLPSIEELRGSPAVMLFLDRAADVAPTLRISEESDTDRRALATISRRLDGIPLAIEFAAARASSLSLDVLARRLNDRFALLAAGKRATLPRQQTLRATLDWSYQLLTPLEQHVLQRVGIFVGGWSLEAAAAVCSDDLISESHVVDLLSSLVDKSLVVAEARSETRYRLLEATRDYALERLVQGGDYARVAARHADYFCMLAKRNDTTQGTADSQLGLVQLSPELDNFRAAFTWAIDEGNDPGLCAALVESLRWFFAVRSLYVEGIRWCEATLDALGAEPPPAYEAAVQLTLAAMMGTLPFYQRLHYYRAEDTERFLAAAERAAELLRVLGASAKLSLALSMVAMHLRLADRRAEAEPVASKALEVARASENRLATAAALYAKSFSVDPNDVAQREQLLMESLEISRTFRAIFPTGAILIALGELAFEEGQLGRAIAHAAESAAIFHAVGSSNAAHAQVNVAAYSLASGDVEGARKATKDVLAVARRNGDLSVLTPALHHAAAIAIEAGRLEAAARLFGAYEERRAKSARLPAEQASFARTTASLRGHLSLGRLEALMDEGRQWTLDRATSEAISLLNDATTKKKR